MGLLKTDADKIIMHSIVTKKSSLRKGLPTTSEITMNLTYHMSRPTGRDPYSSIELPLIFRGASFDAIKNFGNLSNGFPEVERKW